MKISVVIPAYNEEAVIGRCLESLMTQSVSADEIIVVDNNCTDATSQIAKSFGVKIISQTIQGIMPSTYAGMMVSTGDIIARCDADSVLPADWLATIKQQFTARPDVVALTGPGEFYDTNILVRVIAKYFYMSAYFWLAGSAMANWPLFGSNFAIRRSAWRDVEPKLHWHRTDIHDDMEISMHISPDDRIAYLSGLVVGISPRALGFGSIRTRISRGFNSLKLHWPAQSPRRRWQVRWRL